MITVVQAYDTQQAQCATRATPPHYQMLGGKKMQPILVYYGDSLMPPLCKLVLNLHCSQLSFVQ